jgi:hypothetical protein
VSSSYIWYLGNKYALTWLNTWQRSYDAVGISIYEVAYGNLRRINEHQVRKGGLYVIDTRAKQPSRDIVQREEQIVQRLRVGLVGIVVQTAYNDRELPAVWV